MTRKKREAGTGNRLKHAEGKRRLRMNNKFCTYLCTVGICGPISLARKESQTSSKFAYQSRDSRVSEFTDYGRTAGVHFPVGAEGLLVLGLTRSSIQ
jgi:hypothetical protein